MMLMSFLSFAVLTISVAFPVLIGDGVYSILSVVRECLEERDV
jgi:hypothetical protein